MPLRASTAPKAPLPPLRRAPAAAAQPHHLCALHNPTCAHRRSFIFLAPFFSAATTRRRKGRQPSEWSGGGAQAAPTTPTRAALTPAHAAHASARPPASPSRCTCDRCCAGGARNAAAHATARGWPPPASPASQLTNVGGHHHHAAAAGGPEDQAHAGARRHEHFIARCTTPAAAPLPATERAGWSARGEGARAGIHWRKWWQVGAVMRACACGEAGTSARTRAHIVIPTPLCVPPAHA